MSYQRESFREESGYGRRGSGRHQGGNQDSGGHVAVESGSLLIIDQFMLANSQFFKPFKKFIDARAEKEALDMANRYGGFLMEVQPGKYNIMRDPMKSIMAVVPEGQEEELESLQNENGGPLDPFTAILRYRSTAHPMGRVFVETRCLVFIDPYVLTDEEWEKFRNFRSNGDEKAGRDHLRSLGAAVRYGFNRQGDELGLFGVEQLGVMALWPDVVD